MSFTAIMSWDGDNRVAKMMDFLTREEADAHVANNAEIYSSAFVVSTPAEPLSSWLVDPDGRTISIVLPDVPTRLIDLERNRRIAGGFIFSGKEFQSDPESRDNISGAQGSSLGAMIADPSGSSGLRWSDPDVDFSWTAADNSEVTMTAAECQAFCLAAMQYKAALMKAARALKNLNPIPQDYADDKHWPSRTLD